VALEYRVLSIPTLLFIKDGKVLGRIEEAVTKNVVDSKIKKYFENQ
jgi:thiol-disulfide isomerase/thioredoxin